MPGTAVVAGVGPGFCESFARKLGREGHPVALLGRSDDYLAEFAGTLREEGHEALAVPTDVTDPGAVGEAFATVREEFGPVDVLAHTASTVTTPSGPALDPERFERMWRLYAYGGLLCAREALEDMEADGGTILFFGAAPESGDFAFKSGKDATRGLARSLADEYGPAGVHVAHVVIDGALLNPDVYEGADENEIDEADYIDPDAAAGTCYHLLDQPDRARTFELDLHATDRTSPR